MTTVAAPTLFDAIETVAPVVREYADESERIARLAEPVVDAMRANRLFKGLAPKTLDGYEIDPVGWYKAVEAAARIDGSFGWIMFINGASGLGGQSMPAELSEQLIRDAGSVGAGSVFPFGKAVATEGGYIANGRWTYASGIRHSDTVFGFANIFDGETMRMLMPGTPAVAIVNVPTSDVEILPSWDVCGLSGTGSNDFIMKDLFVPESQVSILGMPAPANPHYAGPLYRLPFMTLFAQPIGAVALGIAQHAIDEVLELAKTKSPAAVGPAAPLRERPMFHAQLAEAVACVNSARAWLHDKVREQYEMAEAGKSPDLNQRVETQLAASNATRSAYKAVEIMYLAGGGTSNFRKSPLQRCMRDIHAVTQHAGTNPATWEFTGATMAGMPLQNPLILL
ncbi:MAG: acyl-CoA dehydrogenase family protein [Dehalococcoidia bacterium]